ncbi:MAG: hypothetical protein GXO83_06590 [Chlorobi bacterium]|nr:hypothetical protein [Chlorobiota bacterium]
MRHKIFLSGLLMLSLFPITKLQAQENADSSGNLRKDAVKVFIDCRHCDMDHIRREIPYVNYVRDVREAEVYVLETSQSTGSGGRQYTILFQGLQRFQGMNDTLVYNSQPDDTRDITREGRTKMIKMGMMRYVARTPLFKEVEILPTEGVKTQEVKDKWNYWVFELRTEPQFEAEESLKDLSWDNSINVSRITPAWKLESSFDQSFTRKKYVFDDTTYTRDRSYWSFDNLIVKSLTDHWSAGVVYELKSSSYRNIKFGLNVAPAIEYNIFPYSESTRRQLRILYGIGYIYNRYQDTTIYNKIVENLFEQQLRLAFRVQQKWGYVNVSLQASGYMQDLSKNRLELDGYMRIRLFKGFSLRLSGSVARINDQLSLVKGDLDEAEILLRIRELATAYRVDGRLGIVYTFGSIYNNIVNPRFGN